MTKEKRGRPTEEVEKDMQQLLKFVQSTPRTMAQMTAKFEVGQDTIYKWFNKLAGMGYKVTRTNGIRRPAKYGLDAP